MRMRLVLVKPFIYRIFEGIRHRHTEIMQLSPNFVEEQAKLNLGS